MPPDPATIGLARSVTPRALQNYARALDWQPVATRKTDIAVFHRPDSKLRQILVPLDVGFTDYGEMVEEAIRRLAEFENRPPREVLDHLLLPPADLVEIGDEGPQIADGTIPLNEAADLIVGARRALLAQAHSVIQPQPFHPRLCRNEAERLVNACQFGSRRGGFKVIIACPLDAVPTEAQLFDRDVPFTRQVTTALMQTLAELTTAAEQGKGESLLQPNAYPLLSANLCEALVMMRPLRERNSLTISVAWSRADLPAPDGTIPSAVRLLPETFELAEALVPRLRTAGWPKPDWFVGFVDGLNGLPGENHRPAGEVIVTLMSDEEVVKARLSLNGDDYAVANQAHMTDSPVVFQGVLYRSVRGGRVEQVRHFQMVPRPVVEPVGIS
jgi:hypothetical protein